VNRIACSKLTFLNTVARVVIPRATVFAFDVMNSGISLAHSGRQWELDPCGCVWQFGISLLLIASPLVMLQCKAACNSRQFDFLHVSLMAN
jgi:hypothetical protein